MKRLASILLATILIITVLYGYNKYDPDKKYSLAELQEDLNMLYTLETENHTYYFSDKSERAEIYKQQAALLKDGMTELEFYRVLSPIIESLHCGHSYMKFSKNMEDYSNKYGNYLPLPVKVLGNKVYVLKSNLSHEIPAGSEIIEINKVPIEQIVSTFLSCVSSDGTNTTFKYFKINRDFNKLLYAHFFNTKEFDIKYISPKDNKLAEAKVAAISLDKLSEKSYNKQEIAESKKPKLEINKKANYAILTVSSFDFYDDYSKMLFNRIIDEHFKKIKDSGVSNLVMDLRGNIGGAPFGASHILTYLAEKPVPYFIDSETTAYYPELIQPMPLAENRFKGKIFTLIDGGCFSTTGHLCALLKYYKIGVFIGEETGGSFACSDGSGDAELKNTKLIAHGSTQVYTTAAKGLTIGRGIMPDYPVIPTISDCLGNKDAVKQFALDLIN